MNRTYIQESINRTPTQESYNESEYIWELAHMDPEIFE
jgi:hypothetical protein